VKLQFALVRPPSANFADGLSSAQLGRPRFELALQQHESYCRALEDCGLQLTRLPADPRYPDATFVEDTAILTDAGAVLTRPGAPTRRGEVDGIREALDTICPVIDRIASPGTVDGGDVCRVEDRFYVGISARTNERGASQLAEILGRLGYRPSLIDVRGLPGLLHLKSGLAWLGGNRFAAIDAVAALPALRDAEIIRVDASEAYAANCVLCNGRVLTAAGFPRFEVELARLGATVVPLTVSEFQKMDGGLSCLSLRC